MKNIIFIAPPAAGKGTQSNILKEKYVAEDEIPFDFTRRRLSVAVSDGTKTQLITKGAVEEILSICTMIDYKEETTPITKEIKNNIEKQQTGGSKHV